jgi:hypothetical protein
MESKKLLGQFYTTNSQYILQNLTLKENIDIIEPFVGQGDLIQWVNDNIKYNNIFTYDVDPKTDCTEIRDTLINPPDYKNKYVITNPPYLAKNKNKDKTIYDKYNVDDLYKAFLFTLINGDCEGGVVIIPLNFFSSENSNTRLKFLTKYEIGVVNVFEEQVFSDTSYTICSFNFFKKENIKSQNVKFIFHPSKTEMYFNLDYTYGFRIGGEILSCKNIYGLGRLLENGSGYTNMTLYAVDSGTNDGRIRLVLHNEPYFGKQTDRVFCTITSKIDIKNQDILIKKFNKILEKYRLEYNSLFLTNYRESTKHYSRKRISFKQAFCLLSQIISSDEKLFLTN